MRELFDNSTFVETTNATTVLSSRLMSKMYWWMTLGLMITAGTSYLVMQYLIKNPDILAQVGSAFFILLLVEIGLVWFLSARITQMSIQASTFGYCLYSALNGVTLTPIFMIYTGTSIAQTFIITASMFALMALYGTVTKRNLSSFGNILMMALIGLLVALVVNLFFKSPMMNYIISGVGVVLFSALTAYDVNKFNYLFKQEEYTQSGLGDRLALLGALSIYLDFINLFLFLLSFFGRRK